MPRKHSAATNILGARLPANSAKYSKDTQREGRPDANRPREITNLCKKVRQGVAPCNAHTHSLAQPSI